MGQNYCNRCDRRHNTPVGRNCSRKKSTASHPPTVQTTVEDLDMSKVNNAILPPGSGSTDDPEIEFTMPAAGTASLEDRMTNLESMLSKLTENLLGEDSQEKERRPRHRHRSASWSSTDSNLDSPRKHSRRQRSPSKSTTNMLAYEAIFAKEDFRIYNFEGVMLALFKTLELFKEENHDTEGLIRHGRFLAEKAVADVYVPDTFVHFDKYVRSFATKKGFGAFNSISELDKSRFFNLENHREVRALKNKSKQGKKSNGTCHRYNGELGCFAQKCNYVHRCSNCEVFGHAVKDCKASHGDKSHK